MEQTTRRIISGTSVFFFLFVLSCLLGGIFAGQLITWFLQQGMLVASENQLVGPLGMGWFLIQAVVSAGLIALFFFLSNDMLRKVYGNWLLAIAITLPAAGLHFVDPNQDQLGLFLLGLVCLIPGAGLLYWRRASLFWNRSGIIRALALVPWMIWPFFIWGATGSLVEILLALFAGLAFGILFAALFEPIGHFLLDALSAAGLLLITGSAVGYEGSQILWICVLPASAFFMVSLASSSTPGVIVGVGLLAAAPLMLVDPTELSVLLGDLTPWVFGATFLSIGLGWAVGLPLWGLSFWKSRPNLPAIPIGLAIVGWSLLFLFYFIAGRPGFYGDRLFVIMKDQADLSAAPAIRNREERLDYVYQTLTEHANTTQADLRGTLRLFGVSHRPYYLVNAIEVDGGGLLRLYLSLRPDVARVIPSPRLRPLPRLPDPSTGPYERITDNPGWNIEMIGADKVWDEFGVTGQGIVVGQSDSGVDGSHPALADTYRGKDGKNDYNWLDPWNNRPAPYDIGGHGTHTLGTILGQGGIGVAPGATWIGCVNLNRNLGNPALYLDCMQFMLAPFPQGGDPLKDGDPHLAAHVLNNSWGCPPLEGCDPNALRPGVEALRAAGIFVVASAGNDGPSCETVQDPLALYDAVFSVGAIDRLGNMAGFSSRGPVTIDGSGRVKPDISAPGVDVFSAMPGGTYQENSGTSMAGPHLVGAVALLWSANPGLIGDIDQTEQILIKTARPYRGSRDEGCFTGKTPSNAYGYGVLDIYAAVKSALEK